MTGEKGGEQGSLGGNGQRARLWVDIEQPAAAEEHAAAVRAGCWQLGGRRLRVRRLVAITALLHL